MHRAPTMVYYGAINAFIGDHTAIVYDSFQFTDYLNATFAPWLSAPLPFHPWLYPPTFLLVLLPFACVPFGVSYAAFQIVTFAGLAGSLWRTTKKKSNNGLQYSRCCCARPRRSTYSPARMPS
jgi:alpha-1,2-mannosyltransferase